ncbi:MAG: TetR/AcrR family transcriptional regulator [Colwellia sp.]|nr:TetR/AcrR family transcriptional regulator [Colwellia sp.]
MPYTKKHKENTRIKILESAFRLFTAKGFDGVTVNVIMNDCGLTRGAFYAHFTSKADLYAASLKFSASSSNLAKLKPVNISDKEWVSLLLDGYLSFEHVQGIQPCPLAFLATDINTRSEETKAVYAGVYHGMNKAMMEFTTSYVDCDEQDILSVTAMIIGAVAIARTMGNKNAVIKLLAACRREAGLKLGVI